MLLGNRYFVDFLALIDIIRLFDYLIKCVVFKNKYLQSQVLNLCSLKFSCCITLNNSVSG